MLKISPNCELKYIPNSCYITELAIFLFLHFSLKGKKSKSLFPQFFQCFLGKKKKQFSFSILSYKIPFVSLTQVLYEVSKMHCDNYQVSGTFHRAHTRILQKERNQMYVCDRKYRKYTEFPTEFLILKKALLPKCMNHHS